jgi:hypothetical protein
MACNRARSAHWPLPANRRTVFSAEAAQRCKGRSRRQVDGARAHLPAAPRVVRLNACAAEYVCCHHMPCWSCCCSDNLLLLSFVSHCVALCRHCPILDVMLRGLERGVGMCTDVALYAMHAGARIIPMPKGATHGLSLSTKAQAVQQVHCACYRRAEGFSALL